MYPTHCSNASAPRSVRNGPSPQRKAVPKGRAARRVTDASATAVLGASPTRAKPPDARRTRSAPGPAATQLPPLPGHVGRLRIALHHERAPLLRTVPLGSPRAHRGDIVTTHLRLRLACAGISGDPARIQAAADELQALLADGDPEAIGIYSEQQHQALGPDPLASGACDWPPELVTPATVLDVPADAPLYGWRMWTVRGSHLVAPFLTGKWGLSRNDPGVAWKPGVNRSIPRW